MQSCNPCTNSAWRSNMPSAYRFAAYLLKSGVDIRVSLRTDRVVPHEFGTSCANIQEEMAVSTPNTDVRSVYQGQPETISGAVSLSSQLRYSEMTSWGVSQSLKLFELMSKENPLISGVVWVTTIIHPKSGVEVGHLLRLQPYSQVIYPPDNYLFWTHSRYMSKDSFRKGILLFLKGITTNVFWLTDEAYPVFQT